ncbi:hypothetical protein M885DRAFT_534330 [Pelagophyceae sp. CCMP2097]|nr:hypothetical protein M885DRAFT_534330 [Pelagophyceae sp. CCMP2097]
MPAPGCHAGGAVETAAPEALLQGTPIPAPRTCACVRLWALRHRAFCPARFRGALNSAPFAPSSQRPKGVETRLKTARFRLFEGHFQRVQPFRRPVRESRIQVALGKRPCFKSRLADHIIARRLQKAQFCKRPLDEGPLDEGPSPNDRFFKKGRFSSRAVRPEPCDPSRASRAVRPFAVRPEPFARRLGV